MLHRQLGGIIVEYSFAETMLDEEDILVEYRLFANTQKKKANLLLDSFLSVAKTYIVYNYLREISVVPFKKSFKKPPPSKDMGTFYASDGYIGDLSTLTRVKDFSLYEDEEKIVVFGTIKMRAFKVSTASNVLKFIPIGSCLILVWIQKIRGSISRE